MKQSNRTATSEEAHAEVSSLRLVEFALIGMGLIIAAMSLGIFLTMST